MTLKPWTGLCLQGPVPSRRHDDLQMAGQRFYALKYCIGPESSSLKPSSVIKPALPTDPMIAPAKTAVSDFEFALVYPKEFAVEERR